METFDLYTLDGRKAKKTMIRGTRIPEGYYRYIIHVIVFSSKGEMLIQQRQPFKKGWSGMWDVSAGGSVVSGETIQEGAERETREELGLELSLDGILPSLCLRFDEGINVIYLVQKDVDPAGLHLQAEEVQQVKWAGREEILKMIDEGTFVAYNKGFIDLLFHFHSNNDIFIAEDPTE
ncbi:MAG: NUDIX domain-containing protein [Solobacterium sp.]|nr:NUDIX domain-containing protein [Solobacterium sp.]MBQ1446212.1 NUDIX domain-containing protein [Solobacterium sp.]MBQ2689420.1 NUDIX domain-containing protein [Solobacterium sp.]MBQ6593026.1 NUDIX domain-containing protein [Solobacterium sp.]